MKITPGPPKLDLILSIIDEMVLLSHRMSRGNSLFTLHHMNESRYSGHLYLYVQKLHMGFS